MPKASTQWPSHRPSIRALPHQRMSHRLVDIGPGLGHVDRKWGARPLFCAHGEPPDAEDTRQQQQQWNQDHRQRVVSDEREHVVQPKRRGDKLSSRHLHVPQVIAENQQKGECCHENQGTEVPRLRLEQLGGDARPVVLRAEEAPQREHGDSGLRLTRADDRAVATVMADPRIQALDERLPQSQQGVANAPAGKGHRILDQIAGERATPALVAAGGVELSIPPNVG